MNTVSPGNNAALLATTRLSLQPDAGQFQGSTNAATNAAANVHTSNDPSQVFREGRTLDFQSVANGVKDVVSTAADVVSKFISAPFGPPGFIDLSKDHGSKVPPVIIEGPIIPS